MHSVFESTWHACNKSGEVGLHDQRQSAKCKAHLDPSHHPSLALPWLRNTSDLMDGFPWSVSISGIWLQDFCCGGENAVQGVGAPTRHKTTMTEFRVSQLEGEIERAKLGESC